MGVLATSLVRVTSAPSDLIFEPVEPDSVSRLPSVFDGLVISAIGLTTLLCSTGGRTDGFLQFHILPGFG
jgi:hypothetical protein